MQDRLILRFLFLHKCAIRIGSTNTRSNVQFDYPSSHENEMRALAANNPSEKPHSDKPCQLNRSMQHHLI